MELIIRLCLFHFFSEFINVYCFTLQTQNFIIKLHHKNILAYILWFELWSSKKSDKHNPFQYLLRANFLYK